METPMDGIGRQRLTHVAPDVVGCAQTTTAPSAPSAGAWRRSSLAREARDGVRQVIALGSPDRLVEGDCAEGPQALWNQLRRLHVPDSEILQLADRARAPLTVPATSISCRNHGFAPRQQCTDDTSSHGLNSQRRPTGPASAKRRTG